jgi:hypothetical protein
MGTAAQLTRENRTITVDFRSEAMYFQLLGDGKAFLECVLAFVMSLGFQLKHKATCRGGWCLTRHSHYVRVRLGGLTIWRIQCTRCKVVFTVLPHFVLRYRQMRPEVARDALMATHGGLSLEWCAVIYHISPMALYRLVCAFGHQSLVTVLTRCGLPLPTYLLVDEKHSCCLTDKVYLPTIVCGRVLWHLGYAEEASAAAFTQSYQVFQRAAVHQEPTYPHSIAFSGGGYPHSSKASRRENLEIEQPVACRDYASFDFHPTLPGMLGPTLIGHALPDATDKKDLVSPQACSLVPGIPEGY